MCHFTMIKRLRSGLTNTLPEGRMCHNDVSRTGLEQDVIIPGRNNLEIQMWMNGISLSSETCAQSVGGAYQGDIRKTAAADGERWLEWSRASTGNELDTDSGRVSLKSCPCSLL